MESYLTPYHYDLVTPDGKITHLSTIDKKRKLATVKIDQISPAFVGYEIEPELVAFNLKSTLAQLGIHAIGRELHYDQHHHNAHMQVELTAIGPLAQEILN